MIINTETMKDKKPNTNRLYEYRIRYNAGLEQSAFDSYHYYNAEEASQALSYHNAMMAKKGFDHQTISIEKKNPYSLKWEDESYIINQKA
jgi:hypothetical protein